MINNFPIHESLFEQLRSLREVKKNSITSNENQLTVFLGLFNAEQYLPNILRNLQKQESHNFQLLIVDNDSTDHTWEIIQSWLDQLPFPITLVKNSINLGSTGSQALNMDLISSEWFAFMHQDDFYKNEHFKTIIDGIAKIPIDVVAIYTCMGSINADGKPTGSLPRQATLLPDNSPQTAFLANLKQHFVTWPSAAFKTTYFVKALPAWHSTSFPDTEIILKLSAYGKFHFINKETMMYREHESSESHSTSQAEIEIGVSASLARVFASQEFITIASEVKSDQRSQFLYAVKEGIFIRLSNAPLSKMVELIAEESLAVAWGYSEPSNLSEIQGAYRQLGVIRVDQLIDRLLNQNSSEQIDSIKLSDFSKLNSIVAEPSFDHRKSNRSHLLKFYIQKISRFLPKGIRDIGFKLTIRVANKFGFLKAWNFRWI